MHTIPDLLKPDGETGFEDMVWLFACNNRNRKLIRQNFDEAALLWRAVRATSGPILEIGRRFGGATLLLAAASGDRPVTSLDIAPQHKPRVQAAFDRIARDRPGKLTLLVRDSTLALPGASFGMIFVDGDHSYDGVRADLSAHWPALAPQDGRPALAVFHDAVPNDGRKYESQPNHCPGVAQVCDEVVASGQARVVASAGSALVLEKTGTGPLWP